MRKSFMILMLLLAFNLTAPNSQAIYQRLRHTIEYSQEDHSRDLSDNEVLKKRVITYIRLQMLVLEVSRINCSMAFNTS